MKLILVIIIATLATTLAAPQIDIKNDSENESKTIISNSIRAALEDLKEQLRNGFPNMQIPPLAPFEHDYEELNIDNDFLSLYANITNLRIDGADNYDIKKSDFELLSLRLTIDLNFNNLHLSKGMYSLKSFIDKELNGFEFHGDGDLDFAIENLKGFAQIELSYGWTSFSVKYFNIILNAERCKSNITGLSSGGISTDIINRLFSDLCVRAFKSHENEISKALNDFAMPQVKDYIENISYWDILGWITGWKQIGLKMKN